MRFMRGTLAKTSKTLAGGAVAATLIAGGAATAGTAAADTQTQAGGGIVITNADGSQGLCTLNSVTEKDGVTYGTTAGHCLSSDESGSAPVEISTDQGQLLADEDDIAAGGVKYAGAASPFDPYAGLDDFAWFRLNDSVQADATGVSSVSHTGIPVLDGYLNGPRQELGEPVDVSEDLVGTIVCKDGTMSGRTCGPVLAVNADTKEITALIPAIAGDSGSPLHVAGQDGKRHIVGTLSNGTPVLFNTFDGTREHLDKI